MYFVVSYWKGFGIGYLSNSFVRLRVSISNRCHKSLPHFIFKMHYQKCSRKIHCKKDNLRSHFNQPPRIILITRWPGYEHFFHKPEIHSWFFNFHDKAAFTFPIWLYHWRTMFGCSPSVLPNETKEGWDFWITNTPTPAYETYTKEVQFFKTFNIAWIYVGNVDTRIIFLTHSLY